MATETVLAVSAPCLCAPNRHLTGWPFDSDVLRADVMLWIKPGSNNKSMHDVSKQCDDAHNGGCNSDARYSATLHSHHGSAPQTTVSLISTIFMPCLVHLKN